MAINRVGRDKSYTGRLTIRIKLKLNPWHYSSEEPRPTEVFAAKWQYRGPCG